MRSKREIVLMLRREHMESHREFDPECPFCQRKRDNAVRLITAVHEDPLINLVQSHINHWHRMGAQIANRANAHGLPASLVGQILSSWISAQMDLPDTPEDYLDHPLVIELFEQQKNEDSE